MLNYKKISLVIVLLLLSFQSQAVVLGYVTGNDYINANEETKWLWLQGVMDGIIAENMVSTKKAETWLGKCIQDIKGKQIIAMFDKELKNIPEWWDTPVAIFFHKKMRAFCEIRT